MIEKFGWLLDVYEDVRNGVAVWFLEQGGRRCRLHQPFPVTFYASGSESHLHRLTDYLASQPVPLRLSQAEKRDVFTNQVLPFLAVEVLSPSQQPALFRQVCRRFPALTYGDADLPISLRYAAATGAFPLAYCRIVIDGSQRIFQIEPLESCWALNPSHPPLRVISLEPDADPGHTQPRFLVVRAGTRIFHLPLPGRHGSERPFLINLRALLQHYDPDLLLTTWGDTWLMPLLLEWSAILPLPLNRDDYSDVIRRKERIYFSYGQTVFRGQQVHLFGRWHIDRCNAMLWDDYDLHGVLEVARVTALPVQVAARVSPGTGISSIQMLTALRQGVIVPWQKQQAEHLRPAEDLFAADQGGLVYQPLVGLHHDVAEIDFVSMYPAIMVNFNISPETIQPPDLRLPPVPGLTFPVDQERRGLVPEALAPVLQKRIMLKTKLAAMRSSDPRRKSYHRRATALKWLLVTCFGYLGYKNARFGRIEAHQAVTAYGREALVRAKETAEEMGFEVLHLYVDGMWVRKAGCATREAFSDLLQEINQRTGLPISLDGIYRWVAFLPSRMDDRRPVASRYFGVFQDDSIKVRGIEARRRDTPPFIAETQKELLELLAASPDPFAALPRALQRLRQRLDELSSRRVAVERLVVGQKLTRSVEAYRSPSPAARAAHQLQQAGKIVRPGQRIRFLFTYGEPGVYAWDLPDPLDISLIDIRRYRTLLLRAASVVLQPFGCDEAYLLKWQNGGASEIALPGKLLERYLRIRPGAASGAGFLNG